jgi:hypothetical protein
VNRYAKYDPADEPAEMAGDSAFQGVNLKLSPNQLPTGILADGRNVRCRTGAVLPRKGLARLNWLNRPIAGPGSNRTILGWDRPTGCGVFRDPNGIESVYVATAAGVYRCVEGNWPAIEEIPAGHVANAGTPVFEQAFDRLLLCRGSRWPVLVLREPSRGFVELIPSWTAQAFAADDAVRYGPIVPILVGEAVLAAGVVTVTQSTGHGLIDDQTVTLTTAGGRVQVAVTVVTPNRWTCRIGVVPTAWSADVWSWRTAAARLATDVPGVAVGWVRDRLAMPHFEHPKYTGNRLLAPTAYLPGTDATVDGYYGRKRDFLLASDVLGLSRFQLENAWRINQGADDALQSVVPLAHGLVVALKSRSVYLLENMTGDLSELTLRPLITNHGVVNPRAWALCGKDVVFVSQLRGVCTLGLTQQGQIQGQEITLSDPVEPWIQRINWGFKDKIRCAYWDSKLYVAVPMDRGECLGTSIIPVVSVVTIINNVQQFLTPGVRYRWHAEGGAVLWINSVQAPDGYEWTYTSELVRATVGAGGGYYLSPVRQGVNNAVLVYDFNMGAWQSIDTGHDLAVREFAIAQVSGRDRLIMLLEDGWMAVAEEHAGGDQAPYRILTNVSMGLGFAPINSQATTRGYSGGGGNGWNQPRRANVALATQAPDYSISIRSDGVNELRNVLSRQTKDRTKYDRPVGAPRYDESNANHDFDRPFRQDYSVEIPAFPFGFDLGAGVVLDMMQDHVEGFDLPRIAGRYHQIVIQQHAGSVHLRSVTIEQTESERRLGSKI